jgi:hypothetical protein
VALVRVCSSHSMQAAAGAKAHRSPPGMRSRLRRLTLKPTRPGIFACGNCCMRAPLSSRAFDDELCRCCPIPGRVRSREADWIIAWAEDLSYGCLDSARKGAVSVPSFEKSPENIASGEDGCSVGRHLRRVWDPGQEVFLLGQNSPTDGEEQPERESAAGRSVATGPPDAPTKAGTPPVYLCTSQVTLRQGSPH